MTRSLDEEGGALDYQKVVHPRAKLYWLYKENHSEVAALHCPIYKMTKNTRRSSSELGFIH
jgi:hypothetical protein